MVEPHRQVDVEFSFALHEKTGKFFIGDDICRSCSESVSAILYWRARLRRTPSGLLAKLIGRLMALEVDARQRWPLFDAAAPRIRSGGRTLHLDPWSVLLHELNRDDIVLCHDIGPLTHAELYPPAVAGAYRHAYQQIARVRPFMVFVSEASKAAFGGRFGADFRGMEVVHPRLRRQVAAAVPRPPSGVRPPFLLTVGSLGRRKNQARAIEAFRRSGLARDGFTYVLCGAREMGHQEVLAAAAGRHDISVLGYVDVAELAWLYGAAQGFVLTSLLEGFGIPVAEAMFRRLPVLVSVDTALREVAGEHALVVDPLDIDAIAVAMRRLCFMTGEERESRLAGQDLALERFTGDHFGEAWRRILGAESL